MHGSSHAECKRPDSKKGTEYEFILRKYTRGKMKLEDRRMITLGGEQRWEEVMREASGQLFLDLIALLGGGSVCEKSVGCRLMICIFFCLQEII